jgi:hypothetical protein
MGKAPPSQLACVSTAEAAPPFRAFCERVGGEGYDKNILNKTDQ